MPDLNAALVASLTPVVQQAVNDLGAEVRSRLTSVEGQVAALATAAAPQVAVDVAAAGQAIADNAQHDPVTQRVAVWAITGVVLVLIVFIVVTAAAGDKVTQNWIAAAPIGGTMLALWHSNVGSTIAKKVGVTNG